MLPLSKICIPFPPSNDLSVSAGIRPLGLMSKNHLEWYFGKLVNSTHLLDGRSTYGSFCSVLSNEMPWTLYGSPSSSRRMLIFMPFGVWAVYRVIGCELLEVVMVDMLRVERWRVMRVLRERVLLMFRFINWGRSTFWSSITSLFAPAVTLHGWEVCKLRPELRGRK